MDINCITISKILTPLQAAHYMVNAYPQHCDALALRWGGSEGHEPGTAELCCAVLGWAGLGWAGLCLLHTSFATRKS